MQLTKGGRGCGKTKRYVVDDNDIRMILEHGVREGRKIGTNLAKTADFVLDDAPRIMKEIKSELSRRAIERKLLPTDRVDAIL